MLSKNETAPVIIATSISGERVYLPGINGKNVLLKFHRFSGCPVAQRQIHEFIKRQNELNAAGIETIVFIHSPVSKIVPVYKEVAGLHIVADPQRVFCRLYHSAFSWLETFSVASWIQIFKSFLKGYFPLFNRFAATVHGIPSDFLIDQNGIIRDLRYGSNAGDSWNVSDVLKRAQIVECVEIKPTLVAAK